MVFNPLGDAMGLLRRVRDAFPEMADPDCPLNGGDAVERLGGLWPDVAAFLTAQGDVDPVFHAAKWLLGEWEKRGGLFRVQETDDGADYAGPSAALAWESVEATTESTVAFFDANGERCGWAYLMTPGSGTCAPHESVVDHSMSIKTTGKALFVRLCDEATNGGKA